MKLKRHHGRAVAALATTAVLAALPGSVEASTYTSPQSLTDGTGTLGLGTSVSVSSDGTVAVVGEPDANSGAGAALVYDLVDGTWTFEQRLTAPSETGAGHFGAAVSMDPGGGNLLIGAPDDDGGVGAAWPFALSDGTWSSQGKLTPDYGTESGDGRFGASVAITNGGEVALVGAPDNANGAGQAYTFYWDIYHTPPIWYQNQDMDNVPGAGAHFGASVALSSNGSNAAVGAPDDGPDGNGVVYNYAYFGINSSYWFDQTPIDAPAGASGFGASVTTGNSGEYVVIGAPGTDSDPGSGV